MSIGEFHVLKESIMLENVQQICHHLNVTPSAFFQAALLYVLCGHFGVKPSLGVVVSGRANSHEAFENVIGPMFNTIPCGINNLARESALTDLVRACQKFNADVMPYQHTPLRSIAHYIGQDVVQGLFDTLFVFQKAVTTINNCDMWDEVPSESSPDFPLNLEVEQSEQAFNITIVAKAAYLDIDGIKSLLQAYIDVIQDPEMTDRILPAAFWGTIDTAAMDEVEDNELSNGFEDVDEEPRLSKVEVVIRRHIAQLASAREDTIHRYRPNIFELGLDSIEAMKLAARLKDAGLKVTVSAIMKAPTIAGIAQASVQRTDSMEVNSDGQNGPPIADLQSTYRVSLRSQGVDLAQVQHVLPVTPMQEGLLLEADQYLNVMTFQLKPGTHLKRLISAWETVANAEPILRTRFAAIEDADETLSFVQHIQRRADPLLVTSHRKLREVVDGLRSPAQQDPQDQRTRIAVVVRDDAVFLVLAMPHALYDAWSLHLLHQKVAKVYRSGSEIRANLPSQYQKQVEGILSQGKSMETQAFWGTQISTIRPTIFKAKVANQDQKSPALLLRKRSGLDLKQVLEFCRSQGVTLQSLGLACWTIALAHYNCQLDVCFGLVLSGRTMEGADQTIFPTFNTVVLRPNLKSDCTVSQALRRIHDVAVQVSEYQHYPLREALRMVRNQGVDGELFNTLFTFQKLPTSEEDIPALYDEISPEPTFIKPPYAVNIELESDSSELLWTAAFQQGMTNKLSGKAVLTMLCAILTTLMSCPDQPLIQEQDGEVLMCGLSWVQQAVDDQTTPKPLPQSNGDQGPIKHEKSFTATEAVIRDVLANVVKLDAEQITKTTGIFHIGLDSVSAIKVASLLRKKGIHLPVSAIIRAQTVEKMAAAAKESKKYSPQQDYDSNTSTQERFASEAVRQTMSIPVEDVERLLPATAGQKYMLDMWSASGESLFYPTFWLKVAGTTANNFKKALSKLATQLPILRTSFVHHLDSNLTSTWQIVLKPEAMKKYSLPWAIRVLEQNEGLFVTLRIHHALYDAVSFRYLLENLEKLCSNTDFMTQLIPDMSTFLARTTLSEAMARQMWTRYLPHDQMSALHGTFSADRTEIFDPKLIPTTKLNTQLRQHGLSIQALFFTAYARVYSSLCLAPGHDAQKRRELPQEAIIGIYLANRSLDIDNITKLVAPTFNIVSIRVQLGLDTLLATAQQVQHDLAEIGSLENCGVSMREIHAWTGVRVNTFINFLSLPDDAPGNKSTPNAVDGQVRITHADVGSEERTTLLELEAPSPYLDGSEPRDVAGWCLVSGLKAFLRGGMKLANISQPSIDIEAKVEDGYLGVGVFAPEDMLSKTSARGVMEELKSIMLDFC